MNKKRSRGLFKTVPPMYEPGYSTDCVVVLRAPDLLQTHNVVVGGRQVVGDGGEPDNSVPGHAHPDTPAVEGEHLDGDHLQ